MKIIVTKFDDQLLQEAIRQKYQQVYAIEYDEELFMFAVPITKTSKYTMYEVTLRV